jgi:hypothetical protein
MKDSSNNVHNIGTYKDGLFKTDSEILKLDINKSNSQYSLTSISSDRINYNKLIHNRFAHINDAYINIAINRKLVTGIKINLKSRIVNGVETVIPGRFRSTFCESCILSKSIRVSSTKTPGSSHIKTNNDTTIKQVRFSNPLEEDISSDIDVKVSLVVNHSTLHLDPTIIPPALSKLAVDIKGPINVADKSYKAKKYALIFTCITTRFRFVSFLKTKEESVKYTEKLLNYIRSLDKVIDTIEQQENSLEEDSFFTPAMQEILRTRDIKSRIKPFSEMKSDNGTEFVNTDMELLLDKHGVFHSTTSPYTPHQNAIAERSNRTIFDLAAACMHACGISIKHWTHAVSYVIHTLNHVPNKALSLTSTPYIQVFKAIPNVSYFRTFGCDAYLVLPEHKRPSFGLRAVKGIFIGYCHPFSLAYKILYNGTIYHTGHVYFNEDLSTLPPPHESLTEDINKFFAQLQDHVQREPSEIVDNQLTTIDGNQNDTDAVTNDPSNRRIEDIQINESFEPVSKRTRKSDSVESTQQAILLGTYFHTPASHALVSLDAITIEEAMLSSEWPQWQEAIQAELTKLASINTWEEVHQLPHGRRALSYKWVLKKKYDIYNKLIYKARLTVKGCSQRPGIDFNDTFSPVAKLSSVRLILSFGLSQGFKFRQYDVENAFPNASLTDVDIFMLAPRELTSHGNIYLKLNRALYGLKQASREWNILITKTLKQIGFTQFTSESCLFTLNVDGKHLILALYVDDMIVAYNTEQSADWLFNQLSQYFKLKQNTLARCLGFNVVHNSNERTLTISKDDYAASIIETYKDIIAHIPCQSVPIPNETHLSRAQCPTTDEEKLVLSKFPFKEIIGKLNYFTCTLRMDINFAVNYLARFMDNPGKPHIDMLLNVLAYIRDWPYASITYKDPSTMTYIQDGKEVAMEINRIYCFVDADFASSDLEHRRSVTGYIIMFNGGVISWKSTLQRRVSASSTEAEYRALHEASKECIWITRILAELGYMHTSPIIIFEDNTSTIAATQNPVAHSKLKHLETIYHQIREFIQEGQALVLHIQTEFQLADLLTKLQPPRRHHFLANNIISILPANK